MSECVIDDEHLLWNQSDGMCSSQYSNMVHMLGDTVTVVTETLNTNAVREAGTRREQSEYTSRECCGPPVWVLLSVDTPELHPGNMSVTERYNRDRVPHLSPDGRGHVEVQFTTQQQTETPTENDKVRQSQGMYRLVGKMVLLSGLNPRKLFRDTC